MRLVNEQNNDPHIDWSRFGTKTRDEMTVEAAEEKVRLGLRGKRKRLTANVSGRWYDISDFKCVGNHE